MPQKRWRIDGNFVASPGEFLLQGNPTLQTTHCALVECQMLKVNKVNLLSELSSGVPPVIFRSNSIEVLNVYSQNYA